jgi:hypothetical protein
MGFHIEMFQKQRQQPRLHGCFKRNMQSSAAPGRRHTNSEFAHTGLIVSLREGDGKVRTVIGNCGT